MDIEILRELSISSILEGCGTLRLDLVSQIESICWRVVEMKSPDRFLGWC